jgi:hypothetical protein
MWKIRSQIPSFNRNFTNIETIICGIVLSKLKKILYSLIYLYNILVINQ